MTRWAGGNENRVRRGAQAEILRSDRAIDGRSRAWRVTTGCGWEAGERLAAAREVVTVTRVGVLNSLERDRIARWRAANRVALTMQRDPV